MTLPIPSLSLPITTRRLHLRDYAAADAQALAAYACEPAYWQYQRSEAPTAQQVEGLLQLVLKDQASPVRAMYFLAAARKDTGEIVGEGVVKIVNAADRQGEIGFGVAPRHWKQGFGFEIAQAMLEAAFGQFKLHRVIAQCTPDNKGSIRIMQKLGMAREGLLREVHHARGKWWSTAIYATLDHEYAKIRDVKKAAR
jgi:ribosomal-protein-alanine N-acetyltransferase